MDSYRFIFLSLACGTILERVLFNSLYKLPEENNLICKKSEFWPSGSCEYQLLSIENNIYSSLDCNPPVDNKRCVFGYV